jgi:hypothetical protein
MSLTQLVQFDSKYKSIEKFANLKEWKFPNSINWYTISQNGYNIKMSDTGITLPTKQYSISFFYNLNAIKSSWTNIFHITNTGNNYGSNGDRIPAVWVFPDETRFHIRMSTNDSINDGIYDYVFTRDFGDKKNDSLIRAFMTQLILDHIIRNI